MRKICTDCGLTPIPEGGHSTRSWGCLQRQNENLKTKIREYIAAHNALVAAGTTPERPVAAQRLADAWIALKEVVK